MIVIVLQQMHAVPMMLAGREVLGCAPTGLNRLNGV